MKKFESNLISKEDLEKKIGLICNDIYNLVSTTIGPYGKNSIYALFDSVRITKDGWTLISNYKTNSVFDNCLKSLITDVPANTVLTAGDGTSTSMVGAILLRNELKELIENNHIVDMRKFENDLVKVIDLISDYIMGSSTEIDKSNPDEIYKWIYRIAMMSTNRNEDISKSIATIYKETKNPVIKLVDSKTFKTYHTIINGFDLAGHILKKELCNAKDENDKLIYETNNPAILIFSSSIREIDFDALCYLSLEFRKNHKPLILLAKSYETGFTRRLIQLNINNSKENLPPINIIAAEYSAINEVDRDILIDFATIIGANVISPQNEESYGALIDIQNAIKNPPQYKQTSTTDKFMAEENEQQKKKFLDNVNSTLKKSYGILSKDAGTCSNIKINDTSIIVQGFDKANNEVLNQRRSILEDELNSIYATNTSKDILTDGIIFKKTRLSKLQCTMGILHCSGYGDASTTARKHAADDAIKACELAFRNGFNKGCCFQIIEAVRYIDDEQLSDMQIDILQAIERAYKNIIKIIISNKFDDVDKYITDYTCYSCLDELIDDCICKNAGFNAITNKLDDSNVVINPSDVDISILRSSLRLILTTLTIDKALSPNFENDSEITTIVKTRD